MASTDTSQTTATTLPQGTWRVDSTTSELGFAARGMFGLANVKGTFSDYEGTLQVDDAGARGELHVKTATLDTANKKRDEHLRSADFFASEDFPVLTFALTGVSTAADGTPAVTGNLLIRENRLEITAPVEIAVDPAGALHLSTKLSVDRTAAGVGWSKMGMIRGDAHLHAALVLQPVA